MSIILCILICTPAFAVIPEGSIEHTVTILSGEGRILKNKDETYANKRITLTTKEDFEEIESVEYSIVDGEKLTNMMDYSNCDGTIYTAPLNDKLFAKLNVNESLLPRWREVTFVTSTRMAKHILSYAEGDGHLELTARYTDAIEYYTYQNGKFLPVGVKQLIMFMPNEETQMFSHFVDQDGNIFKLDEPITKDLVLTPVYTSEHVTDTMDMTHKQFHQVTYLPGEGRMEYVRIHLIDVGGGTSKWLYDGYAELDRYDDVVYDGNYVDTYCNRLIDPYVQFQDRDLFSAYNLLKREKEDVVSSLNNNEWMQAYTELDEAIIEASQFTFSSPYYYQENTRPYSISFLAFLGNYTVNSKKLSELLEDVLGELYLVYMYATGEYGYYKDDLERNLNEYFAWDWYYKSSEVAETDPGFDARLEIGINTFRNYCLDALSSFESTAEQFISLYTHPWITLTTGDRFRPIGIGCNKDYSRTDIYAFYYENDNIDRAKLYDDSVAPGNRLIFIPPEGYEFDHLEDQYGNTFDPKSTTVTEDLVLTPIYRELHEYHLTYTKGEGEMRLLYKYSPYYDGAYHSTVLSNQSLDELSIRSWRGIFSYTRETDGEMETMSSSDYLYLLNLRGTSEYESYTARDNYERMSNYSDGSNLWFIPPMNKIFDHFEDENGDVWESGTELTKDTIITPIYRDIMADALITVETEDNSDEAMQVYVNRDLHKFLSESGFDVSDYNGTVFDYLNDKSCYAFNESDWEITEDGVITKYTGDLVRMLGIPDSINGITVTEISTHAFDDLFERTKESQENPNYYDENDYLQNLTSVWVPKSVTNLTGGLNMDKMVEIASEGEVNKADAEFIKQVFIQVQLAEAAEEGMSDEELAQLREQLNESISISIDTYGTNDCTPFAFLPYSYIVVDP